MIQTQLPGINSTLMYYLTGNSNWVSSPPMIALVYNKINIKEIKVKWVIFFNNKSYIK